MALEFAQRRRDGDVARRISVAALRIFVPDSAASEMSAMSSHCVLEQPFEFEQDAYWTLMGDNDLYNYFINDLYLPVSTSLTCMDLDDGTLASNSSAPSSINTARVEKSTNLETRCCQKEFLPIYSEYEGRFLRDTAEESDADEQALAEIFPDLFQPPVATGKRMEWSEQPNPPVPQTDHTYCQLETQSHSEEEIDVVSCSPPPYVVSPARTLVRATVRPAPQDTSPDRRSHHNILERQRRSELRDMFEKLRREVPELVQSPKAAKQAILTKASAWIQKLRNDEKALMAKKEFYIKQLQRARQKLKYLSRWCRMKQMNLSLRFSLCSSPPSSSIRSLCHWRESTVDFSARRLSLYFFPLKSLSAIFFCYGISLRVYLLVS